MESPTQLLPFDQQVQVVMQQLASELRLCRYRQWISQAELAEGTGMPQSTIARFESGKSNPTLKTLLTIVAALGVKLVIDD
jgi:transcriptional regulator with XRE-family HTH domain